MLAKIIVIYKLRDVSVFFQYLKSFKARYYIEKYRQYREVKIIYLITNLQNINELVLFYKMTLIKYCILCKA